MSAYVSLRGRKLGHYISSVQSFSYVWLCDPMDYSTLGFPVHHQLPEFIQTHVHWVGDAIQASLPWSSPSPPAFNLSQHQGLFQWVGSLHQVLEHQVFGALCIQSIGASASTSGFPMNIQDWFPLGWTDWISLQSKGLSRVFSNTKSINSSKSSKASILRCSVFFIV